MLQVWTKVWGMLQGLLDGRDMTTKRIQDWRTEGKAIQREWTSLYGLDSVRPYVHMVLAHGGDAYAYVWRNYKLTLGDLSQQAFENANKRDLHAALSHTQLGGKDRLAVVATRPYLSLKFVSHALQLSCASYKEDQRSKRVQRNGIARPPSLDDWDTDEEDKPEDTIDSESDDEDVSMAYGEEERHEEGNESSDNN
jgi:hypothetical protein